MSDNKAKNDTPDESANVLQPIEGVPVSSAENVELEEKRGPLSPDEFRSVLERIDALGLTWTADIPPLVKLKAGVSREAFASEEYELIKEEYPSFPRELSSVIFYALTGSKKVSARLGRQEDREDIEQKVAAVKEVIINTEYRSEFFFKYAIKVPYFSDLDWEVVIKTHEKNVNQMPRIAYALLSLIFRQPVNTLLPASVANDVAETETFTVAVDEYLVDKLIKALLDVKDALKQSRPIADSLSDKLV